MMIFKRNKPEESNLPGQHVMRGRKRVENETQPASGPDQNPLARRFHPDDEPDTIELAGKVALSASAVATEEDPATRDLSAAQPEAHSVISYVPDTGKFYLQGGGGPAADTSLNGNLVEAPTELRHGDRIQIAGTELLFQTVPDSPGDA